MRTVKIARTMLLAAALAASLSGAAYTQDTREPARTENQDNDFGWIGLLGLAGLFGLMRRDRDRDTVRDRDRVAAR